MKQKNKAIKISDEVAARCDGPDQLGNFNKLVNRILAIPAKRADSIRGYASVNPNPRGRPRKASVSRVPDVRPHA